MGYIYLRTNKVNGKKYVGQVITRRFKARQNRWNNLKHSYAGPAINNARAKYGLDAFDFEILKECEDEELNYWEKYYIKELNTRVPYGYNMTDGGDGNSFICKDEKEMNEIRHKISIANKGRKRSEELKKQWSKAHKGKYPSEETRKKLSKVRKGEKNPNYGKHWSEEAKKIFSEKNSNHPSYSKSVLQIDINTNEVIAEFPSTREIERQFGFLHSNISKCCNGKPKYKTAYGYIWKYKEESVA